ncbi:MAG: ABC transporter permease, partial [Proteobacteria bacterium]|nr:ABC transporter permease [Pseudomonadota bacterium]
KGFAEQYILVSLMADRLSAAGLSSTARSGLGSAVVFEALAAGDVDVYVDYSGTVWTNYMRRTDSISREEVLRQMTDWLDEEHDVGVLGVLGFENAYAMAMRRDRAEELGIRSIADLVRHARDMAVGGDVEIFGRPEWQALEDAYGLVFREQRQMQPTFMYRAVADGEVDVITAFSSDGRIVQYDLVLLDDPEQAIPPYDAVVLIAPARRDDAALTEALRPLIGAVTIERMREANLSVSRNENPLTTGEAARRLWQDIVGP